MRTLGVDLAADPKRTAMCAIDWDAGLVELWPEPVGDEAIVTAVAAADRAGFDVPLGWPDGFVDAVATHHTGGGWPPASTPSPEDRLSLRFRATDRSLMAAGHRPLSVSTDLIGVASLRGARIQHLLREAGIAVDRSGLTGPVAETYPAAALRQWGLRSTGYKGRPNAERLRDLVASALPLCGDLATSVEEHLVSRDDEFDAFVCALVARAIALGLTTAPETPADREAARREGWIHVPTAPLEAIIAG